jgi:hypothetical protein
VKAYRYSHRALVTGKNAYSGCERCPYGAEAELPSGQKITHSCSLRRQNTDISLFTIETTVLHSSIFMCYACFNQ